MSRAMLVLDTQGQRRKATDWVWAAKNGSRVEFKAPRRTDDQNAKMWVMLSEVATQVKHHGIKLTPDDWKLLFLDALKREVRMVPNLDGNGIVSLGRSSSDLSKEEMSDLIELIHEFGARNGVTFHTPNEEPSSPAVPPVDDAGSGDSSPPVPAAEPSSSSQAADPAGGTSGDEPEQPSADLRLSDEDRAWLVTVFKVLKAAVGPDVDVLKRQSLMFKTDAESKSALVKAKATKIRTELEKCCGDKPESGTVAVGKYVAALIGVDEKDLRT